MKSKFFSTLYINVYYVLERSHPTDFTTVTYTLVVIRLYDLPKFCVTLFLILHGSTVSYPSKNDSRLSHLATSRQICVRDC